MSELYTTRIDVPEDKIKVIVDNLNVNLANTMLAQMDIKFAHWNVKGDGFHPTHLLFDQIYDYMADASDTIAERITALGGVPEGKPWMVTNNSQGFTYAGIYDDNCRTHIEKMSDYISDISNAMRKGMKVSSENGDLITQDVYIGLVRGLEKFLYFLEASLRA